MSISHVSKRAVEHFESLNFAELYNYLLRSTQYRLKMHGVSNIEEDDFIMNAIKKLLSGQNKWDIDKYPDPKPILRKNIWRDICNEIKKRKTTPAYKEIINASEIDFKVLNIPSNSNLDDKLFATNEIWEALKIMFKEDFDICYLLEVMEQENIYSKKELAKYCDWKIEKVYNIFKRILRKTKSISISEVVNHE